MSDKFVDERVPKAREARAMARQYNQLQDGLAELKVAIRLLIIWVSQSDRNSLCRMLKRLLWQAKS